ncbi:Na+-driven multidrug efflux pump [Mycoplasma testudineum]|uniref:Probable multidrug resistance protein NorM n=1 Tax=Mycoplasma testudineum TaxID=244584 RepID=A0A4R6IFN5_9MOLU|nr:MATE family efflux transporter [Mycoplasma testudineum]OYD26909.1 hypothetical protein CG473_01035 [Mycoplasma testudineum]TDO20457.1 Na+-driven multidrug efflux pump [Mycoplasma testudineum]
MSITFKKFFVTHFPQDKKTYKEYFNVAFPIIFASILFALNNFIDNFMVTTINGGVAALSIANIWTGLLLTIFVGISFIGTSAMAQFYGKQDYKRARDTLKFRFIAASILSISFFVTGLAIPEQLIRLFSPNESTVVVELGAKYIRIITVSWLLLSFSYTYGAALREVGLGKLQMYASIITLSVNIIFNSIFIFALNLGVEGAAWASVIARVAAMVMHIALVSWKKKELVFNPIRLIIINSVVWKLMSRRFIGAILISASGLTVNLRNMLWNFGYPAGTIGDSTFQLSAAAIIGITGSISGIFLSAIPSISATTSIFVGWQLGQNNIGAAKKHSTQLKGFNFLIGFIFSLLLVLVVLTLPYMTFVVRGQYQAQLDLEGSTVNNVLITSEQALINANLVQTQMLREMQLTLIPITALLPTWMWFISSSNSVQSGGWNSRLSIIELATNIFQFSWLIFTALFISKFFQNSLWISVIIFYLSDIPKILPYELVYYKANWATNVTDLKPATTKGTND